MNQYDEARLEMEAADTRHASLQCDDAAHVEDQALSDYYRAVDQARDEQLARPVRRRRLTHYDAMLVACAKVLMISENRRKA